MLDILSITAPIYLVVAMGFLCTRAGLFARGDMRVFGKYVINLALPALLFNVLSNRRPGEVIHPLFVAAYALGSLAVLVLGVLWARQVARKRPSEATIMAMGMCCPNSSFIGYPVVALLLGPATAGVGLALAMLVENCLLLPLALALAENDPVEGEAVRTRAQRLRHVVAQSARGIARNPMMWGIAAGFLFAVMGWRLPQPVALAVNMFAMASASLALFVIGGSLVGIHLGSMKRDVAAVAIGKLLLHPLAVFIAVLLLPTMARERQVTAVVMAAIPMLGIYPILAMKHGHDTKAAAAQLGTTVASFFTLTALVWFVKQGL